MGWPGVRAVEEILSRGGADAFAITVFGDEPYGNYNRILLSNVLAGSDDTAEIYLNPVDWYLDNDIDLRAGGVRVVKVDRYARVVHADDGTAMHYDRLILATGSRSFFPPDGRDVGRRQDLDRRGVFGFRSLDDCAAMIDYATGKTKGVVIGGGLLGLEAARGLQSRGLTVDVVHATSTLMNAQLDDAAGAILRRSVENIGITVHTDTITTKVVSTDGALTGIVFADGTEIACDMLVVSAGIRPNVGLAQRAGLTVERAIVVDDHMRSIDDDNVYVVGECAQHRGQVYGLVAPTVGTGRRTGRSPHRHRYRRGLSRVTNGHETEGRRRRRRVDGPEGTGASRRRVRPILRTQTWHLQDHRGPRRQAGRRHPGRRRPQGRVPDAGLRPRPTASRGTDLADVRHRHPPTPKSASPNWPATRKSATATVSARTR